MSDPELTRILRDVGLAKALAPPVDLRQREAVARVVDSTGAIIREAAAAFRTPQTMDWGPNNGNWRRVARAGRISVLAAHCETAPSTGDATIMLSEKTATSGSEVIATLTVPQGQQYAEVAPNQTVAAGTLLTAVVTTANGAATVNMFVTCEVG